MEIEESSPELIDIYSLESRIDQLAKELPPESDLERTCVIHIMDDTKILPYKFVLTRKCMYSDGSIEYFGNEYVIKYEKCLEPDITYTYISDQLYNDIKRPLFMKRILTELARETWSQETVKEKLGNLVLKNKKSNSMYGCSIHTKLHLMNEQTKKVVASCLLKIHPEKEMMTFYPNRHDKDDYIKRFITAQAINDLTIRIQAMITK
jgi:hypothetical protein